MNMTSTEKEIFVLYGSQTGNAESIAKELNTKLKDEFKSHEPPISVQCMNLNSVKTKKISLRDQAHCAIIVCSTTGNGDSPENSDGWWRSVKLRSLSKETYIDLPFCVLGMGDTNYDKFCYMGKSIDKRMAELGGVRFLDLYCADEATNMEETVEEWKKVVLIKIKSMIQEKLSIQSNCSLNKNNEECSEVKEVENKDLQNNQYCGDTEMKLAQEGVEYSANNTQRVNYPPVPTDIPSNLLNLPQVADLCKLTEVINSPIDLSIIPKLRKDSNLLTNFKIASNVPEVIDAVFITDNNNNNNNSSSEYTVENPFKATVLSARFLTSQCESITTTTNSEWGDDRHVVHLDLDTQTSGMQYSPGDSIGICVPNPSFLVDKVIEVLKLSHVDEQINFNTIVTNSNTGKSHRLGDLLTHKYDLTSPPRKAAVLTLADCCQDPTDRLRLQYLCSKGDAGKTLWMRFVEDQRLGTGELLLLIPSCRPTVSELLSCLGNLPPRFYSISSSPLQQQHILSIAFSVVHYTCRVNITGVDDNNNNNIKRYGLCTSYLDNVLSPWLRSSNNNNNNKPNVTVNIFHKPTLCFRLPGCVSHPLILIGPGTGVSPFIGFLQHRQHRDRNNKVNTKSSVGEEMSTGMWRGGFELGREDLPSEGNIVDQFICSIPSGPVWLYFGCRNESDYIYKQELQSFVEGKIITTLQVAMSRTGPEKVYVTHKLLEDGERLSELILKGNAYVYICGDGNNMAKDVNNAIKKILIENGKMSAEETENYLKEMKLRNRYVQDIWS